jgi:translation initiation factor 3 subunit C
MVELEDHLTDSLQKDKANKKKSSSNSKAMNNLKQKLRKLAKQFDESITAYRKVKY